MSTIDDAITALKQGEVITHATETCYGLAADITNQAAVKKLFKIKKRPLHQPVSALFASIEQAQEYLEWNNEALELAMTYLPGPLTIILPIKKQWLDKIFEVPEPSSRDERTLGVRISPHPTAMELVRGFGAPLTTSSANPHGDPVPTTAELAVGDFILDDGLVAGDESTVIKMDPEGGFTVVRPGKVVF